MRDRGVGSWIERRARRDPDRAALVTATRTLTNADLAARIRRLAHALRSFGVRHGDRVAWIGPNHPAFLELLFAAAKLGAITAPVNHRLDPEAIRDVLADCDPRVVVTFEPTATEAERGPDVAGASSAPDSGHAAVAVRARDHSRDEDYEQLLRGFPDDPIDEPVAPDDVCLLPHTSGTTGVPKGVMLTHGNVTWNALNFVTSTDLRADDVTVAIAPFFRVGGTGVNVLPVLLRGGAVVVPESTDPDHLLRVIEDYRVTVGFANPDLLAALAASPPWPIADLSSVRYFVTGGAPVPERLLRAFLERGIPCLQGYGLSEAGPLVMVLSPEHALDRLGSAGTPPMFVDVRVVRADGTDCAVDETGELLVQGPAVMAGYWRRPEATARALDANCWLHTGDAARRDADGFTWIVDRLGDGFDTGRGRVYPGDVDRVLLEHPDVADAAAVGVPGGGAGSASTHVFVVAAADRSPSEAEILAWCRDRLPAHAVPTSVRFVASLPRNTVGKVIRQRLLDLEPDP